ncbi:MAG: hypothetical protein ACYCY7_08095 [Gallionella sp.]
MQILMLKHGEAVYLNDLAPHRCGTGQPGYYGVSRAHQGRASGSRRPATLPGVAQGDRHVH